MPKLCVVPQDVWDSILAGGISPSKLQDAEDSLIVLSAQDIADIHLATSTFPFVFDSVLEIQTCITPYELLTDRPEHESLYNRVKSRLETAQLNKVGDIQSIPEYRLETINDSFWVAVVQRYHPIESDPQKMLMSLNQVFFDDLIAQVLHTLKFEQVCKTNLFSYYLGACPPVSTVAIPK